jgi:hypothetical protein
VRLPRMEWSTHPRWTFWGRAVPRHKRTIFA